MVVKVPNLLGNLKGGSGIQGGEGRTSGKSFNTKYFCIPNFILKLEKCEKQGVKLGGRGKNSGEGRGYMCLSGQ